ncbi:MAG TPA: DUF4350 domain-containing protein [Pseudolysinimonas sp.]|nr:DUF4350 domain-containing protein [Pseudolysinimonas sp.]
MSVAADEILTATPRAVLRRNAVLIVVAVVALLGVIVIVIARNSGSVSHDPLSATNPAPEGSMAVVRVLEQHGVHVIPTDSLEATRSALAEVDSSDATVMVYDPQSLMTPAQRGAVLSLGTDVVAVEPDLVALPDLAPGVGLTGQLAGSFRADCSIEAVQKAAAVSASGIGFRITATGAARDAVTCLTKQGASGLVVLPRGGRTLSLLGLGSALQNGTIATKGDAALALNLLGAHRTLVWYISSYADLQEGATPSLADLTPGWVTPLLILLGLAGIAAAIWRGRRFGPIVIENLPVVVRASETMEGRARLYARARARLRALDALRIGTVERLARAVGLPRTATVSEVSDAVAAVIGRDGGGVSAILLDAVPLNDAELVRLSDELLRLEADVAATRPGRSTTPEPSENGQHG